MNHQPELALILEPGSPRPVAAIGKILAAELGLFPSDALARVRYGSGILIPCATAQVIESIAVKIQGLGARPRILPAELLRDCHRGYRAIRLELGEEIVCARLRSGNEIVILNEDLRAIQIYGLPGKQAPQIGEAS